MKGRDGNEEGIDEIVSVATVSSACAMPCIPRRRKAILSHRQGAVATVSTAYDVVLDLDTPACVASKI
jgi:hypothetical protein